MKCFSYFCTVCVGVYKLQVNVYVLYFMERNYLLFCLFFVFFLFAEKPLFKRLCFTLKKLSIVSYFVPLKKKSTNR